MAQLIPVEERRRQSYLPKLSRAHKLIFAQATSGKHVCCVIKHLDFDHDDNVRGYLKN